MLEYKVCDNPREILIKKFAWENMDEGTQTRTKEIIQE